MSAFHAFFCTFFLLTTFGGNKKSFLGYKSEAAEGFLTIRESKPGATRLSFRQPVMRLGLGNNYDLYYSGGGVQKANAIVDGVTSCKSPNLFDAQLIRAGEVE